MRGRSVACVMPHPQFSQQEIHISIGVFGAVLVIITVLLLRFRLFKGGFEKNLLWVYWGTFKERAWETFWRPTLLSIIFGLVTLWWSPTVITFLCCLLVVVSMTGYHLWREQYVRLQPRFKVETIIAQLTDTEYPSTTKIFLQVLPECLTDVPVFDCRARLLFVEARQEQELDSDPNELSSKTWLGLLRL